ELSATGAGVLNWNSCDSLADSVRFGVTGATGLLRFTPLLLLVGCRLSLGLAAIAGLELGAAALAPDLALAPSPAARLLGSLGVLAPFSSLATPIGLLLHSLNLLLVMLCSGLA